MARAARVARRPVRRDVEPPVSAPGRALDPPTRSLMEARFAHHFGDVRVHADAASALDDGAVAYTAGRHIVFAPGAYAPRTEDGRWLIAHELAHVVQQERADTRATAGVSAVRFETDADRAADAAVHGGRVSLPPAAAVPSHQRVNTSIVAVRSGTLAGQAYTALGGVVGGMLSLANNAVQLASSPAAHAAPGTEIVNPLRELAGAGATLVSGASWMAQLADSRLLSNPALAHLGRRVSFASAFSHAGLAFGAFRDGDVDAFVHNGSEAVVSAVSFLPSVATTDLALTVGTGVSSAGWLEAAINLLRRQYLPSVPPSASEMATGSGGGAGGAGAALEGAGALQGAEAIGAGPATEAIQAVEAVQGVQPVQAVETAQAGELGVDPQQLGVSLHHLFVACVALGVGAAIVVVGQGLISPRRSRGRGPRRGLPTLR